ncbi:aldo/keto reductase [Rhodococcus sp. 3Y1]
MTAPFELPKLVLGTMTFGDTVDISGAGSMLDAALGAGISHRHGQRLCGRRVRAHAGKAAPRPTRFRHSPPKRECRIPMPATTAHSTEGLRASVEGSLRRLDTDYVDLFYLHQPDRTVTLTETLTTVAELVAEGKIRTLGVSNFAAWQISEINYTADTVGAPDRSSHSSSTTCSRVASKKNTQNSRT